MSRTHRDHYPAEAREFTERVSKNITRIREEKKLSQFALAARAGIHQTSLARIEALQSAPSLDCLFVLSAALHVTPCDLVRDEESDLPRTE